MDWKVCLCQLIKDSDPTTVVCIWGRMDGHKDLEYYIYRIIVDQVEGQKMAIDVLILMDGDNMVNIDQWKIAFLIA